MANINRATQQDQFRKVLIAIPKFLTSATSIVLAGISFTPTTLAQFFQGQINLLDAATTAKAALHQAVTAIAANKTTGGPVLKAFNSYILSAFSNQPAMLADFAVTPRKTKTTSANVKALAVAKVKATRTARKTMGKEQRKEVTGVVPDSLIAALTPAKNGAAGPSPAPAPTPAPAPAGAPVATAQAAPAPVPAPQTVTATAAPAPEAIPGSPVPRT